MPFFGWLSNRASKALSGRRGTYVAGLLSGYLYIAATVILNIALVPVLLLGLGKSRYGIWLILLAGAQWVSVGITWIGPGIVKRIGHSLANGDVVAARTVMRASRILYGAMAACLIAAAAIIALIGTAPWLGGVLTSETKRALILTGIWAAASVHSQVHVNTLIAAQRTYRANMILTVSIIASGCGSIVTVLLGGGLDGVAGAYALCGLGSFVTLKAAAARVLPNSEGDDRVQLSTLKDLVQQAGPFALSSLGWLLLSSDILLLAFIYGPRQVAEYGVAYKLIEASLQVIWRVADTMHPYIVEFDSRRDTESLQDIYRKTVTLSLALGGAVAAFVFLQGRTILDVWVGPGNGTDTRVIKLLSLYLLVQSGVHSSIVFPFATARMRSIGRVQLGEGVFKVIAALTLVPKFGQAGVPAASILALLCGTAWFVPRLVSMWLGSDLLREHLNIALTATPTILLTAASSAMSSSFIHGFDGPFRIVVTLVVGGAGFLAGASLSIVFGRLLRRRFPPLPRPESPLTGEEN